MFRPQSLSLVLLELGSVGYGSPCRLTQRHPRPRVQSLSPPRLRIPETARRLQPVNIVFILADPCLSVVQRATNQVASQVKRLKQLRQVPHFADVQKGYGVNTVQKAQVERPMRIFTKLLHSAWAGYWTVVLLRLWLRHFSLSWLRAEPEMLAIPVLACVWVPFAVGLWFDRRWAWTGAFALSVLSLFVALYIACFAVSAATHEGWQHRHWQEFVYIGPAILVVAGLLHIRHGLGLSPQQHGIASK